MSEKLTGSSTEDEIKQIISGGESQTVEFKRGSMPSNRLSWVITAFANADGGTILMGVEEHGRIVGIEPSQIRKVVDEAVSQIEPRPDVSFYTVTCEGKSVAVIKIPRSERVLIAEDGAFIRVSAITKAMTRSELSERLSSGPSEPDISQLASAVAKQTATIEHLRDELAASNSLTSKMTDYFIGGIIGAVIGAILTMLI